MFYRRHFFLRFFLRSFLCLTLIFALGDTIAGVTIIQGIPTSGNATGSPAHKSAQGAKAKVEVTQAQREAVNAERALAKVEAIHPHLPPLPWTRNRADHAAEAIIRAATPEEVRQWPMPSEGSGYAEVSAESLHLHNPNAFPLSSTPGAIAWVEYASPTPEAGYVIFAMARNRDWCEAELKPSISATVTVTCTINGVAHPFFP